MDRKNIEQVKEFFGGVIPADRNEFFKYVLENMDEMDVLSLHNDEYCNTNPDDYIYNNDEYTFCEQFGHRNPYEVATMLEGTNWRSCHDYFRFDGYGNIESFDNVMDVIDLDYLADYCERNPSAIEDYVSLSEIYLAFCCGAIGVEQLTDEELDNIDSQTLIDEDWDDVIEEIIDNREEE